MEAMIGARIREVRRGRLSRKADSGDDHQARGRQQKQVPPETRCIYDGIIQVDRDRPSGASASRVDDEDTPGFDDPQVAFVGDEGAHRPLDRAQKPVERTKAIEGHDGAMAGVGNQQLILDKHHAGGIKQLAISRVEASRERLRATLAIEPDDESVPRIENKHVAVFRDGYAYWTPVGTGIASVPPGIEKRLAGGRSVAGVNATNGKRLDVFPRSGEMLNPPVSGIRNENLESIGRIGVQGFIERTGLRTPAAERLEDPTVRAHCCHGAPLGIGDVADAVGIDPHAPCIGKRCQHLDVRLLNSGNEVIDRLETGAT